MNRRVFPTGGLIMLLTALLALLLVSFSLLGLSTARQDLARSEQLARRQEEYYAACNRAEEVLAQLRAGNTPRVSVTEGEGQLRFQIPINENQTLFVTADARTLTVTQWQTGETASPAETGNALP